MKKKLGELLIERRMITPSQLADALALQRRNGMRLGAALVQRGHLDETQLVSALGSILGVRVVDLSAIEPDPAAVDKVSRNFASEHDLFPFALRRERGRTVLTVAMSDPLDYRVVDELGFITNTTIETMLARAGDIDAAIRRHYGARFDRPAFGNPAPVRLDSDAGTGEMTILRPGGDEERVNTETGPIPSPFVPQPPPAAQQRPPPAKRDDSAVLLTEEVSDSTPVSPAGAQRVPAGPATSSAPIPLTSVKRQSNPPHPDFDASLGVLLDAAGEAVNAETFLRLEKKFWALMRVLAKKGVLTNEDFLRELGEQEEWGGSSGGGPDH
jgi:hypothetical protein